MDKTETSTITFLLGTFIGITLGLAVGWFFGYFSGEEHVVNCLKTLGLGC